MQYPGPTGEPIHQHVMRTRPAGTHKYTPALAAERRATPSYQLLFTVASTVPIPFVSMTLRTQGVGPVTSLTCENRRSREKLGNSRKCLNGSLGKLAQKLHLLGGSSAPMLVKGARCTVKRSLALFTEHTLAAPFPISPCTWAGPPLKTRWGEGTAGGGEEGERVCKGEACGLGQRAGRWSTEKGSERQKSLQSWFQPPPAKWNLKKPSAPLRR